MHEPKNLMSTLLAMSPEQLLPYLSDQHTTDLLKLLSQTL